MSDHCGVDGAEQQGKALNLSAHLVPTPYVWSYSLGSEQKDKAADTSGPNEVSAEGG